MEFFQPKFSRIKIKIRCFLSTSSSSVTCYATSADAWQLVRAAKDKWDGTVFLLLGQVLCAIVIFDTIYILEAALSIFSQTKAGDEWAKLNL